jgi:hypothetical protein
MVSLCFFGVFGKFEQVVWEIEISGVTYTMSKN